MTEQLLKADSLSKSFGGIHAVREVSFAVATGQIKGIIGPNGAGKTTTLEIMETLRKKTSGSVEIDGIDLDQHIFEILDLVALAARITIDALVLTAPV